MAKGPAMSRAQAVESLEAGIGIASSLVAGGIELLGTGDMGIGNTTPSSAVLAVFSGRSVRQVTGRGTGIGDSALDNKVRVIEQAIALNQPDPNDALDVLAKVGGFEIGGIAGLILGAAFHRVPVVIDGLISSAGALVAKKLSPAAADYMIAAHQSMEPGHRYMLEELGLKPILNLNLRLGEGTGAALAMPIVETASRIIHKMLTFTDAGVTGPGQSGGAAHA
jgi:nicotinate-nucleotide--dimethylbenzimidazole phosphoribosyltransferase